jgi:hypothetical protein
MHGSGGQDVPEGVIKSSFKQKAKLRLALEKDSIIKRSNRNGILRGLALAAVLGQFAGDDDAAWSSIRSTTASFLGGNPSYDDSIHLAAAISDLTDSNIGAAAVRIAWTDRIMLPSPTHAQNPK